MEKVEGIGGLFFLAEDPPALAAWYETHLGVTRTPESYDGAPWTQAAGPTVFQPFPADTDYFGSRDRQWMVNFRVRDLDAMVAQLTAAGIAVEVDATVYPNGRFAHLADPEGNRIELWEGPQGRRPLRLHDHAGALGGDEDVCRLSQRMILLAISRNPYMLP